MFMMMWYAAEVPLPNLNSTHIFLHSVLGQTSKFKDRQYFYQTVKYILIWVHTLVIAKITKSNLESQHARFSEKLPGMKSRVLVWATNALTMKLQSLDNRHPSSFPDHVEENDLYMYCTNASVAAEQSVVGAAQASGPGFNFPFPLFCFIPSNVRSLFSTWSQKTFLLNFDWIFQLSLGLPSFPGSPAPERKYAGRA